MSYLEMDSVMLVLTRHSSCNDCSILSIGQLERHLPFSRYGGLTSETRNIAKYRESMIVMTFRIGGYACWSSGLPAVVLGSASAFSASPQGSGSIFDFPSSTAGFASVVESSLAIS